ISLVSRLAVGTWGFGVYAEAPFFMATHMSSHGHPETAKVSSKHGRRRVGTREECPSFVLHHHKAPKKESHSCKHSVLSVKRQAHLELQYQSPQRTRQYECLIEPASIRSWTKRKHFSTSCERVPAPSSTEARTNAKPTFPENNHFVRVQYK